MSRNASCLDLRESQAVWNEYNSNSRRPLTEFSVNLYLDIKHLYIKQYESALKKPIRRQRGSPLAHPVESLPRNGGPGRSQHRRAGTLPERLWRYGSPAPQGAPACQDPG